MIEIPGYRILRHLCSNRKSRIFSGVSLRDSRRVILKCITHQRPEDVEFTLPNREFELAGRINHPFIIKYLRKVETNQGVILILEDPAGQALADYAPHDGFDLPTFFNLALQITQGLEQIHQAHVTHCSLNPHNILFCSTEENIKIIDFCSSTGLESLRVQDSCFEIDDDHIPYISPEQSGRINRALDYRSDLYSLGATFYQMLTGHPPFSSRNKHELLHCHVAMRPIPLGDLKGEIPTSLSLVISKLLEKNAEDRYQSAAGLLIDLKKCRSIFEGTTPSTSFSIATHDISERFKLPQKLYGRERELEALLEGLEQASKGQPVACLVSGVSGIGKTALVQEIQKPVFIRHGNFVLGKFDQISRTQAFGGLTQAFSGLIRQFLGENDQQIAYWSENILKAIGNNGQLIIDLLPELELIIGPQPPVPPLDPLESQNRFRTVMQRFVGAFIDENHPLVLFLDDLQWADLASLYLIKVLTTQGHQGNFMFVGAYRDNEVDPAHPTMHVIDEIKQSSVELIELALKPLSSKTISHWLTDTFEHGHDRAEPLANLVNRKTEGNPFFIREFLGKLLDEGYIEFDSETGWNWRTEDIAEMEVTENVAQFLYKKFGNLPVKTSSAMTYAACLGSTFTIPELSKVLNIPSNKLMFDLSPAITAGMIFRKGDKFHFAHDRLQEVAYNLIPIDLRAKTHLEIGETLSRDLYGEAREENLFDYIDHLNLGRSEIHTQDNRLELAQLNLIAGKRAKKATAYASAKEYFETALECLPENGWEISYPLSAELHRELSETYFLLGEHEKSKALIQSLLSKLKTETERAELHGIQILQHTINAEYKEGIELSRKALKPLGINLPVSNLDHAFVEQIELFRKNLGNRSVPTLVNDQEMSDPTTRAAMKILFHLQPTAYLTDLALYKLAVTIGANLSLCYGNTVETAKTYSSFSNTLCGALEEYGLGYEFSILAIELSDKYQDPVQQCRTRFIYACFINHWKRPYREAESYAADAFRIGLECGDIQYAGYTVGFGASCTFYSGTPLQTMLTELERNIKFTKNTKHHVPIDILCGFRLALLNLTGKTESILSFDNGLQNEPEYLAQCRENGDLLALCFFFTLKAQIFYIYNEYPRALEALKQAEDKLNFIRGTSATVAFNVFQSLTLVALLPTKDVETGNRWREKIEANQRELNRWANNCPENFRHLEYLISAELYNLDGNILKAMEYYDKAIDLAGSSDILQDYALANERAGIFYRSLKRDRISDGYLSEAVESYIRWGAEQKVKELLKRYPNVKTGEGQYLNEPGYTTDEVMGNYDLETVTTFTQILFEEKDQEKLLSKIMRIILESSGAQRGALIFKRGEDLMIESTATEYKDVANSQNGTLLEDTLDLPQNIIRYVLRTDKTIAYGRSTPPSDLIKDPYILKKHPNSVLCMPVRYKERVQGALYLENRLSRDVFTNRKIGLLQLMTGQAAISLENARLYRSLTKEIKDRKVITESLRKSEEFLKGILANSPVAISVKNRQGQYQQANKFFRKLFAKNNQDIIGLTEKDLFAPSTAIQIRNNDLAVWRDLIPIERDETLPLHDGDHTFISLKFPLLGPNNDPIALCTISTDITERKKAESRAEKEKEKLDAILKSVADGLIVTDENQRLIMLNQTAEKLLGIKQNDVINAPASEIIENKALLKRLLTPNSEPENTLPDLKIIDKADGFPKIIQTSTMQVKSPSGTHSGYVTSLHDLTGERHLDRMKSEFISTAAHELRTPLTAIIGYTELILDSEEISKEDRKEYLTIVQNKGWVLEKIIYDLLNLSRVESGRMIHLEKESFNLIQEINKAVDIYTMENKSHNFRIILPERDSKMHADKDKVMQILDNLVGNAVKFSPAKSSIEIGVEERDKEYYIWVNDEGIGIDQENAERIFDKFYRVDSSNTAPQGLGLGLTIVKSIVETHGGKISLESAPGKGTKVSFTLPKQSSL